MRALILCLALAVSGCQTTGGVLDFSGEEFKQPKGHEKLCTEQPTHASCPGGKP